MSHFDDLLKKAGRIQDASQCSLILNSLRNARGKWVSMLELVALSGSLNIHSRIDELRHRGFKIENKVERGSRKRNSHYRLLNKA
ncbi:MAG: hypothetical protein KGJ13_03470 [Patescibacteria group bacterium]|nr:hypothetical protein [Patescibacteria group bacterium]